MIFVFGGVYQGKLDYVNNNYEFNNIVDCQIDRYVEIDSNDVLVNFDYYIKSLLENKIDPSTFLSENMQMFENKIIVGNEIGLGVVPIKKEERILRDNVGFAYQILAREATEVIRVWNGIGQRLK